MSIHSSLFAFSAPDHQSQSIDPAVLQLPPQPKASPSDTFTTSPSDTFTQPGSANVTPFWSPLQDLRTTSMTPSSAFEYENSYAQTPTTGSFLSPRPKGPLRGYSTGYLPARRTPTMMSGTTLSPATPNTSFSSYYNPYPSPSLIRRPSAPLMSGTKRVFHPSPATSTSPAIGVDLTHLPMDPPDYPQTRILAPPAVDTKVPRFRPAKEQLEILITAYDENKSILLCLNVCVT